MLCTRRYEGVSVTVPVLIFAAACIDKKMILVGLLAVLFVPLTSPWVASVCGQLRLWHALSFLFLLPAFTFCPGKKSIADMIKFVNR